MTKKVNYLKIARKKPFKCDKCENEPTSIIINDKTRYAVCPDHGGQSNKGAVSLLYRPANADKPPECVDVKVENRTYEDVIINDAWIVALGESNE